MTGDHVAAVPPPPDDWLRDVLARTRGLVRELEDGHDLALLVSLVETAAVMPADARLWAGPAPADFVAAMQARAADAVPAVADAAPTDAVPAGAAAEVRLDLGTDRGRRPTRTSRRRTGLPHVVGWTLLGGVLPGTGLLAAGRRALGGAVLGCCGLALAAAATLLVVGDPLDAVTRVLAHPRLVAPLAAACLAAALLWAALVVVTNLSLRRTAVLTRTQSLASWAVVVAVATAGLGAGVRAMTWVRAGGAVSASVFSGDGALSGWATAGPDSGSSDPWARTPRINMLLLGSDAGANRTGVRTDTAIVASIDTRSGDTVLLGLPRNLEHVPFPPGSRQAADHPHGYACADHACQLGNLWQFGVDHAGTYYGGSAEPGLTATLQGVEQLLGLRIDNYALVDLRGFMRAVDALGGVEVTVPRRIPVGGHRSATGQEVGVTSYLPAGRHRLNGYQALWFARSRSDSDDFARMGRQRCLVQALIRQADPVTVATALPELLRAADGTVRTSIRIQDLGAWRTLAGRVRAAHVRSLTLTNKLIDVGHPDVGRIQELVRQAVTQDPARTAPSAATPSTLGARSVTDCSP